PELIAIAENYGNVALWMSAISSGLMLICLLFYNLDKKKHAEIVAQLKATAVNAEEIEQEEGDLNILEDVVGDAKENQEETNSTADVAEPQEEADDITPQEQDDDPTKNDFTDDSQV
ncbi:MAG: hypothetical protein K2L61_00995, partial [Clostridia bacterium]|nr:hypothetical protein [Clostridia bacterium]